MSGKPSVVDDLYARDYYSWTQQQAELLRAGRVAEIDLSNLAEEIETLGRSEASALRSAYRLILLHLLKMHFQPEKLTRSWRATIARERDRLEDILAENPGLAPRRAELFARAYAMARNEASEETGIDWKRFPTSSPFKIEEAEDPAFWPQS